MHLYLPFSIILILNCLLLFCWSHSLFISVYIMALKRKSTPFRNPLCSWVSSFDSTPSHLRFRDEKARKAFLEKFSWRGIHSECQVILSDFSDTNLPTVIHNKRWESLCDVPVTCPSVIIQEFYSNIHGFDYSVPLFVICVRGTRIVVTPDIVSKVLHIPRVAHWQPWLCSS